MDKMVWMQLLQELMDLTEPMVSQRTLMGFLRLGMAFRAKTGFMVQAEAEAEAVVRMVVRSSEIMVRDQVVAVAEKAAKEEREQQQARVEEARLVFISPTMEQEVF